MFTETHSLCLLVSQVARRFQVRPGCFISACHQNELRKLSRKLVKHTCLSHSLNRSRIGLRRMKLSVLGVTTSSKTCIWSVPFYI